MISLSTQYLKKIQWKYPDSVIGEDKFLCMTGGLNVEKMLWCVSGDWLDGSGWTTLVSNSGVSKSGTAESHIGASHICRTRYVHTVSVAAIHIMQRRAYIAQGAP